MCALIALFLVGCGATRHNLVSGRVVDCESKQGLRATEISVALAQQEDKRSDVRVSTDGAGYFSVYVSATTESKIAYLRLTKAGYVETEEEVSRTDRDEQRICMSRTPGM